MEEPTIKKITRIPLPIWSAITMLGIAGQIAWAVENSWFNVFVYDTITPDPDVVSWMVAMSAITATVTTLIMGTFSDRTRTRLGRRRPYILIGYISWGIVTAIFPLVAWIQVTGVAIVMVVFVDCVMTFFGSTSNDAALNAWVTDISDETNRGRIQGVLSMATLLANLIALGAAGIIIDNFGYYAFFYGLGGLVSIVGLIGGLLAKDAPFSDEDLAKSKQKSFGSALLSSVQFKTIRENRVLFLLFVNMAISGIGGQINSPYLFTYLEYFLGFDKTLISIIGGIVILFGAISSILYGLISHRFDKWRMMVIGIIFNSCVTILFAFVQRIELVALIYTLVIASMAITGIVHGAWMQDTYPIESRGQFQGIRMIFFVLIPMGIGPFIGAAVINKWGPLTIMNGEWGHIPPPHIFIIGGLVSLLSLIPLFLIRSSRPLRAKESIRSIDPSNGSPLNL